jgi:zinc transporter ZupT
MLAPLLAMVLPVALGACLALLPHRGSRLMGPVRTFALTAALCVVFLHLLPEAYGGIGAWVVLLFVAGFAVPATAHLVEHRHEGGSEAHDCSPGCTGLEVGFVGLLVHQMGEGVAVAAMASASSDPLSTLAVFAALGGHTVPLAAAVALAYYFARGARVALVRSIGMAAAGAAGVLLAGLVPMTSVERAEPWVSAAVAGVLIHVVTHDLREVFPRREAAWGLHAVAALLGATFGALPALVH